MSRNISNSVLDAIDDDVVYPFYAIELLFDGSQTLRMWTGVGTLVYEGQNWTGTGSLLNIDTVEETSEIAAKGANITLSGVPSGVVSLALSEPYQGRVCNIYFGMLSKGSLEQESGSYILLQDGSRILLTSSLTSLTSIFSGYMDQMNIEESAETSSIELLVENKLVDLERARVARFTSSYQKSVYPNDKGLDFVESLQDKEIVWGRKSGS
tara:strand:+ start:1127 stop:1759 length:633 start_codon:yes stop_codon:yes gene_type:complete